MKTMDQCRKHGEATFYNWKVKYRDLEISKAGLQGLESENAKLKKSGAMLGCSTTQR
jgi:hypothetical protein